jgi:hypothetical protein
MHRRNLPLLHRVFTLDTQGQPPDIFAGCGGEPAVASGAKEKTA